MSVDNIVLTRFEPTIHIEELKFPVYTERDGHDSSKVIAEDAPLIMIEGTYYSADVVRYLYIDTKSKIPKIHLILNKHTMEKPIRTVSDGSVICVFLKTKQDDLYRSIRIDFDVDIAYNDIPDEIEVYGTMLIPALQNKFSLSIGRSSSYDAMSKIAKDLGLGFASNIDTTNDVMPRFNPGLNFIGYCDDIMESSYRDDSSFQRWCIDMFYNLNYIELNSIQNAKGTLPPGLFNIINFNGKTGDEAFSNTNVEGPLILSNGKIFENDIRFIERYELIDKSGDVKKLLGYSSNVQFFINDEEEKGEEDENLSTVTVNPLTSINLSDTEIPLRGSYKDQRHLVEKRYVYQGRVDIGEFGNVHKDYNYAKESNRVNNLEYEKLKLKVILRGVITSLYIYQKIPIAIFAKDVIDTRIALALSRYYKENGLKSISQEFGYTNEFDNPHQVEKEIMDDYLSGYYIIESINYEYINGEMKTELMLIRREWPVSFIELEYSKNIMAQQNANEQTSI